MPSSWMPISRMPTNRMPIRTESADDTKAVAAALAPLLRSGDVLLLSGDLGAGKTAFVQGLAAAFGITAQVTSPTFMLAATYDGGRMRLHHLDAYRLENLREVLDLDLPELLGDDAVVCIEWGEVVRSELRSDFLEIHFHFGDQPDSRTINLDFVGSSWQQRSVAVTEALATVSV